MSNWINICWSDLLKQLVIIWVKNYDRYKKTFIEVAIDDELWKRAEKWVAEQQLNQKLTLTNEKLLFAIGDLFAELIRECKKEDVVRLTSHRQGSSGKKTRRKIYLPHDEIIFCVINLKRKRGIFFNSLLFHKLKTINLSSNSTKPVVTNEINDEISYTNNKLPNYKIKEDPENKLILEKIEKVQEQLKRNEQPQENYLVKIKKISKWSVF